MAHKLKIFIAGSKALESERMIVRNVLMQFQTRWNIMIEAKSFEDFGYSLTKGGRQTDYNAYITDEADLVIFVFASKVGNITMSEFMMGYSTFVKKGKPEILVFVEQNRENIAEVEVLKQTMTNMNQYYIEYDSQISLRNLLSEELTKFISEHKELIDAYQDNDEFNHITDPDELFKKGWEYRSQSDFKNAYPLIKRSAEFGNSAAQFYMGIMNEYGQGVKPNYSEAFRWYMKAADQGLAEAECNVGFMYNNGLGVEENHAEAVKWYRKAAEQGNPEAQNNLGNMCHKGHGTPQNDTEALEWFKKAAEQGHPGAQCSIGLFFYSGIVVDKNFLEAIKWFKRAAAQGHIISLRNLGFMYQHGEGVDKDYEEAAKWYRLAAEKGDNRSLAALKELGYA